MAINIIINCRLYVPSILRVTRVHSLPRAPLPAAHPLGRGRVPASTLTAGPFSRGEGCAEPGVGGPPPPRAGTLWLPRFLFFPLAQAQPIWRPARRRPGSVFRSAGPEECGAI